MVEFEYKIQDKQGLHARPVGMLVQMVGKLSGTVTITAGGQQADCKKLIAMMRLGVKYQDIVTFRVEGENEEEEAKTLQTFCRNHF